MKCPKPVESWTRALNFDGRDGPNLIFRTFDEMEPDSSKSGEDEVVLLGLIEELTTRMRTTFGKEVVFGIGGALSLADVQSCKPAW